MYNNKKKAMKLLNLYIKLNNIISILAVLIFIINNGHKLHRYKHQTFWDLTLCNNWIYSQYLQSKKLAILCYIQRRCIKSEISTSSSLWHVTLWFVLFVYHVWIHLLYWTSHHKIRLIRIIKFKPVNQCITSINR